MQTKSYLVAASIAALLALGACNREPEVETVNQYDSQAEALRNAAPVVLPPAIVASRTYRCSDNGLYYVDFYNNNTALIRRTQQGASTTLTAPSAGAAYAGEAYTVSANADNIRINSLSCHI
jgi:hypothetical protein